MPALRTYCPGSIGCVAAPKGMPQESSGAPAAIGLMAKRWPTITVESSANVVPFRLIVDPASSRRVAMATLSPAAAKRAISSKAMGLSDVSEGVMSTLPSVQEVAKGLISSAWEDPPGLAGPVSCSSLQLRQRRRPATRPPRPSKASAAHGQRVCRRWLC